MVLLAVIFVIYLSYVFSKYISKGTAKITAAKHMQVIDRLVVGQDRFILIVSVLDKYYLVSVTGQSIEILKELDGDELKNSSDNEPKPLDFDLFKTTFTNMFKRDKK